MHPEQLRIQNVDFGKVLRNTSGARTCLPTKLPIPLLEQHSITNNSVLVIFQSAEIQTPRSKTTYLVYPSTSGDIPEISQKRRLRIQYGAHTNYS